MAIGILLITHGNIGSELILTANNTFGTLPLQVTHLSVEPESDPDLLIHQAFGLARDMRNSDGMLILTDIFGSTPYNIAKNLSIMLKEEVEVISGLNLPMLVRILNYPNLALSEMALKAVSGGKDGVIGAEVA